MHNRPLNETILHTANNYSLLFCFSKLNGVPNAPCREICTYISPWILAIFHLHSWYIIHTWSTGCWLPVLMLK